MDDEFGGMSIEDLVNAASDVFDDSPDRAESLLTEALRREPEHETALFDLGLLAKRKRDWRASIRYFRRLAALLDADRHPTPDGDEERPEWWNIGIAATALHDWELAREAWTRYGIPLTSQTGEVIEDYGITPIRIAGSDGHLEVVWARRVCPTRARIVNVPFPASGHHYGDIVLHDGVPNGERTVGERTYPVFDEIELWSASGLPTTIASVSGFAEPGDREAFDVYLESIELPHENWSNVRMLCRQCSEGNPSEQHSHDAASHDGIFGFAATASEVTAALNSWARQRRAFMFTIDSTDEKAQRSDSNQGKQRRSRFPRRRRNDV